MMGARWLVLLSVAAVAVAGVASVEGNEKLEQMVRERFLTLIGEGKMEGMSSATGRTYSSSESAEMTCLDEVRGEESAVFINEVLNTDGQCYSLIGAGQDGVVGTACVAVDDTTNLVVTFEVDPNAEVQFRRLRAGIKKDCSDVNTFTIGRRFTEKLRVQPDDPFTKWTLEFPLDEFDAGEGCCGSNFCVVFQATYNTLAKPRRVKWALADPQVCNSNTLSNDPIPQCEVPLVCAPACTYCEAEFDPFALPLMTEVSYLEPSVDSPQFMEIGINQFLIGNLEADAVFGIADKDKNLLHSYKFDGTPVSEGSPPLTVTSHYNLFNPCQLLRVFEWSGGEEVIPANGDDFFLLFSVPDVTLAHFLVTTAPTGSIFIDPSTLPLLTPDDVLRTLGVLFTQVVQDPATPELSVNGFFTYFLGEKSPGQLGDSEEFPRTINYRQCPAEE